jgi:hypothetical protein
MLKTLGLALCSAFLFLTLSSKAQVLEPGQVYNTGNIVQTTPQGGPTPWVNGVYQDNLTCWAWGDPGYCGPNAIVRPGGSINFSFGTTNLYQMQAIANVLPSTGTGLAVNGYNFGFTAKNGNGWDDARMDFLTAYVSFYDTKGTTVFNKNYDLNSRFNWTSFNYSETFNTPFASKDLGSVQYGFVGRDNNGWAGPYGPEIYNVNFSLKYSVDPCASNPLYSPTCKGYLDALAKLAPAPTTSTLLLEPIPLGSAPPPPPGSTPPPGSPPVQESTLQSQLGQPQPGTTPPPGPTLQQAAAQPTANNQQPKPGEIADSGGGGKTSSPVSLSSVLSMIGSNQEKTAALEKSVVQAADAQAFSAGETAKQTAEKIAGEAQSQSIAISNSQTGGATQTSSTQSFSGPSQNSGLPLQGNLQSNTVVNSARLEQSLSSANYGLSSSSSNTNSSIQQNIQNDARQDFALSVPQVIAYVPKIDSTSKSEINTSIQIPKYEVPLSNENMGLQAPVAVVGRTLFENKQENSANMQTAILPPMKYESPKVESNITASTQGLQYQPPIMRQEVIVSMVSPQTTSYSLALPTRQTPVQADMPVLEGIKFSGNKTPVESAIETRPFILQSTTNQQSDTVKKNVQNNELAGGVTIESIAKQPTNYAQYFSMIPDAAFYEPKEVYKNQKTVDNVRALRLLSSDRLHQQMVDQQYK